MAGSRPTVKSTLAALDSDKVKDRTSALEKLRNTFTNDQAVYNYSTDDEDNVVPGHWQALYVALFNAFRREKETVKTKAKSKDPKALSSTPAYGRLEDLAKAIRWFTERCADTLDGEIMNWLLEEVSGKLVHNNRLLAPAALDLFKTARELVSQPTYLEHWSQDNWETYVRLCFNVLLGDPIGRDMNDEILDLSDSERSEAQGSEAGLPTLKRPARRIPKTLVTQEQVVCADLLSVLLRSATHPLTVAFDTESTSDAIYSRLERLLRKYPSESSLLQDYLRIVAATLENLALNDIYRTRSFAYLTWQHFVNLWGLKDKGMKEQLLIILRVLFPYIVAGEPVFEGEGKLDALRSLTFALGKEAETRSGSSMLNLSALRLELRVEGAVDTDVVANPFTADTYRFNGNVDCDQSLCWAILELQADCLNEIHNCESKGETTTPRPMKRAKMQPIIQQLLDSIMNTSSSSQSRCYFLRVLLFLVDRHWIAFAESFKTQIISNLTQLASVDDFELQNWAFLNIAAVAFAEKTFARKHVEELGSSQAPPVIDATIWDTLLSHAIRRATVPQVCRAACHAAHAMIVAFYRFTPPSGHIFLSSSKVLLEVEAFGKDLDIQGPHAPHDSVCMFLIQSLNIASQDTRLYRMQLEEKVLSWLMDAWVITGAESSSAAPHSTNDLLLLLMTIAGFSKHCDLLIRPWLPVCPTIDSMKMERRLQPIREFLLNSRLSTSGTSGQDALPMAILPAATTAPDPTPTTTDGQVPGRGRERRISAFLLRMLDALMLEWQSRVKDGAHPTIEIARRTLDFAIIAMVFESMLSVNMIIPTKRVMQSAGKVMASVFTVLKESRWSSKEKVTLLAGLEPIVWTTCYHEERPWETLILPDHAQDGIDRGLREAGSRSSDARDQLRGTILRVLWKNFELYNPLEEVCKSLRGAIEQPIKMLLDEDGKDPMDADDRDGFGSSGSKSSSALHMAEKTRLMQRLFDLQFTILVRGPLLQTLSGEPTRERSLIAQICKTVEHRKVRWFLMVLPVVLREMEMGNLECKASQFSELLVALGRHVMPNYSCSKSPGMQIALIRLLSVTLDIWVKQDLPEADKRRLSQLCNFLGNNMKKGTFTAWPTRDAFASFAQRYLPVDPTGEAWPGKPSTQPKLALEVFCTDPDTRVRFQTAVTLPYLFVKSAPDHEGLYKDIYVHLSTDVDAYEQMMTRFLSLGNIMVASSTARRGPYWHILETHRATPKYVAQLEAVLEAVVHRLGLPSLASLFAAYAHHLATAMVEKGDFLSFPHRLFGYANKGDCVEAAFRTFAPTYIAYRAKQAFLSHCSAFEKKKNPVEGLQECYGDIVGFYFTASIDTHPDLDPAVLETELQEILDEITQQPQDLPSAFKKYADGIVASALRTLADQDCTATGPIVSGMQIAGLESKVTQVFLVLTKHRPVQTFAPHVPNKPCFGTPTVLRSLAWFFNRVPDALNKAIVYHVLHSLFASIHQTPLINEKFRLLNAMCLWVAFRHTEFNDPTLLHAVLHGAASLLSDPSLARAAQSILEWTFRSYKKLKTADSRLSRILIRISSICHEYATQSPKEDTRLLGESLLTWIDSQAAYLAKEDILRPMVSKALAAWPYDSTGDLSSTQQAVGLEDVGSILQDDHITSGKFRVARRLRDSNLLSKIDFARKAFWRLKESLPPIDRLHQDDITAFADILVAKHGQIDSVDAQQLTLDTMQRRQRRANKGVQSGPGGGESMLVIAREAIVYGLLGLLENESPALVYKAYTTLRLMMGAMPQMSARLSIWAAEYGKEVEFLLSYPLPSYTRASRDLDALLADHMFIERSSKFPVWIRDNTQLLAGILSNRDATLGQLYSILDGTSTAAEEMFPILIFILLQAEQLLLPPTTKDKDILSSYFTRVLEHPNASPSTLKSIVDVVLHLRNITPRMHDPLGYNKWLNIDYNLLALSAVKCGAYTTALLFLEIAPDITVHSSLAPGVAEQIQYEIYGHIDEPDGFYGIKTANLQQFLLERFKHEQQWDKAFSFYGAALEARGGQFERETSEGLVRSFHSFGFDHLAMSTLQRSDSDAGHSKSHSFGLDYNLGWRSETWDLPDSDSYTPGAPLYHVLRCVHRERDLKAVDTHTHAALYREMQQLRALGTESVTQIREVLRALMCLNQVVQWKSEVFQADLKEKRIDWVKWQAYSKIPIDFAFSDLENIMSVRISLLRSVRQREERQQIGNLTSPFVSQLVKLETQCLLSLAEAARESDQTQIALNSVMRAQSLESVASFETSQEYANVLWAMKEEKIAVNFLEDLIRRPSFTALSPPTKAAFYARLGTWISEAFLQKPTDVWDKYFSLAIDALHGWEPNHQHDLAAIYHQCAVFADRQYHAIMKSPDTVRWKVYVERKQKEIADRKVELEELNRGTDSIRQAEVQRAQSEAQKLLNADREHHERHNKARIQFLRQSLQMYSRCLQFTDEYDTEASIKFSSLWFSNFDDKESIGDTVHRVLGSIPSRKFIFLAHQLSARLSKAAEDSQSQHDLQQLMTRLCREHPFHSFYQVYCLQVDRLPTISNGSRQSRRSMSQIPSQNASQVERSAAAEDVLAQLHVDDQVGPLIQDMGLLCESYLEWAKYPITPKKKQYTKSPHNPGPWDIPAHLKIRQVCKKIKTKIPVLTAETKIDPSMRYENCVWLSRYSEKFETAGGINMPKVTVCVGEDDSRHKQLFKGEGKDDLRQDAVMEQVFELVNKILNQDRETLRRTLRVRSYKVVPLGTQAGVLEFVGNTAPLREWLQKGHPRYRKDDLTPSDASKQLGAAHSKTPEERLQTYLKVTSRFKPVFRHFFTEKARNPMQWFALRLHYVRSVASTSIVGHILGLGDRHTSNILMDTGTGELVHIDLGIAFDQGKLLAIPETVPFRLTRDMVDGMGIAGTQGVFQRCSEETLRVLRESSDIIMTVLEVFKYDPLHSWTVSEIKIRRAQMVRDDVSATDTTSTSALAAANKLEMLAGIGIDMSSGTAQEAADRALSSVSRKLDKSLSVESTVNELIAEATDPGNLGKIFCGWAPHM